MDNTQQIEKTDVKYGKQIESDGEIYIMLEGYEPPSESEESKIPLFSAAPHYSNGTPWPANYLDHETVVGYLTDKFAMNDGVDDAPDVVALLEGEGLRCCILEVIALQYYGSERLRNDWWNSVPASSLSTAKSLLKARPQNYTSFAPDCRVADEQQSKWPRFKVVGVQLFTLLVPADEVRFSIEQENSIVRGKTGLPFPSLPAFVQSLLDSKNLTDLADLIDGMNLDEDWAAKNGVEVSDQPYPEVLASPKWAWEKFTRSRHTNMGWKCDPKIYATRYRKHGDRDPGERAICNSNCSLGRPSISKD